MGVELHHVWREGQLLSANTGRRNRAKQRNGRHLHIAHSGPAPENCFGFYHTIDARLFELKMVARDELTDGEMHA